ncbi:exo-alpha-sialidase [Luteolibacter marinus]|uniref:exo-alpha-sialidase n=1 Tax=Luteolibacter marinus TaxID=2776705 RepID=UPI0018672CE2
MKQAFRVAAGLAVLVLASPGIAKPAIEWDRDHPVLVKAGAHYGRIARLDAGTLIAGYDFKRGVHVGLSHDEGRTWGDSIPVAAMDGGTCTNTELCVLRNGEVLCFFNFRPDRGSGKAFAIVASLSRDGARTWSPPVTIHTAGKEFENGCWEPACIQLPGDELQLYFANEGPYRDSNEQEVSMLRSKDNGRHWSAPETISFRKGSRDGMPVPVLSRDGKSVFVAIEDNGLSGTFKPVIVATPIDGGGWRKGAVDGDSPFRWRALAEPLPASTYAGAPYLRQLADDRFVISFQLAASGQMRDSRMAVAIGDANARNFGSPSFPFPETPGRAQLWNAVFIPGEDRVMAISETSLKGTRGIWTVSGRIR